MKILNSLKIGVRLSIIIGVISAFTIWSTIKIDKDINGVNDNLENIVKNNIHHQELLQNAEKFIQNANLQIIQGVDLLNYANKSIINQKVAFAGENLDYAKLQLKLYKQNLDETSIYNHENIEALYESFNKYYNITRGMLTYLASPDSVENVGLIYYNSYDPSYKNITNTLSNHIQESSDITNELYEKGVDNIDKTKTRSFVAMLIMLVLLVFGGIIVARSISKPLNDTIQYIDKLSHGELPEKIKIRFNDEIGKIQSVINKLLSGLKNTANFANQIGEGNLEMDYKPLSDKDIIGNSLLDMRAGLKKAKDDEIERKIEDEKRNWTTQGLAKFGEILRKDNDNLTKLANDIVSNLIEYIKANQGGIFVYNDEDKDDIHFELIASYAYNRKKFTEHKIKMGEGLVGTCGVEKETIYMTQVPDDYIEITSGLGEATPNSILIVPLKLEDHIFGIIELASFNEFEAYQIEFVEKIGESIASTLSSVKVNARTAALLDETKLQAEEMATKEEEMRQNLEELKATQEEMERIKKREAEKTEQMLTTMEEQRKMLMKILDHIPEKVFVKDKDGNMLIVNSAVADVHKTTPEELIGKNDFDFFDYETAQKFRDEELEIMGSGIKTFTQEEDISGELKILKTTKMPFYIPHLKQTGLLGVQIDITELSRLKEKEEHLIAEVERIKNEMKDMKNKEK